MYGILPLFTNHLIVLCMKKNICFLLLAFFAFLVLPGQLNAATAKTPAPKAWSAATPDGFLPLTWAKARGISSFYKPQTGNGYLDYLTVIYLPYAQIRLIASSTPQISWGVAKSPFDLTGQPIVSNWAFPKMVTEQAKSLNPDAQFFWNMPFFNINGTTTDLSMALKSTLGPNPYITSGSRTDFDIGQNRRMLIIDNDKATAQIADFDSSTFLASGDQAVEGFAPSVTVKGDGDGTARSFIGVRAKGKELVIYCSRGASVEEATTALLAAGVPPESQLQVDGGASATCAYNLPGQYFVEPGRMLPHLMGAYPFLFRGTITTEGVNVRTGPGTKNKSIAKLAKGAPVIAYEEKNGWVRINQSQQWVFKSLIKQN